MSESFTCWPTYLDPLFMHVEWLWIAALLLAGLLGALDFRRRLRRRAHRDSPKQLEQLGPSQPLEGRVEGELVTLEGTLECNQLPIRRFEDGGSAVAASAVPLGRYTVVGALTFTRMASEVHIDVGGEPVALVGPVEVILGSREHRTGGRFRGLPRAVKQQLALQNPQLLQAVKWHKAAFRSLQSGDRVRARGILRRCDSKTGESYRAQAVGWKLSAAALPESDDPGDGAVALAHLGNPQVTGPRLPAYLFWAALSAIALWIMLGLLGNLSRTENPYHRTMGGDLHQSCYDDPCQDFSVVSALLPGGRWWELDRLEWRIESTCEWTEDRVEDLARLRHREGCGATARTFLEHGESERAEALAVTCEEISEAQMLVLLHRGRFSEASDLLAGAEREVYSPCSEVQVHLLANQWQRAQEVARRAPSRSHQWGRMMCLDEAIAIKAGLGSDRERLRHLSTPDNSSPWCAPLYADTLVDPGERREVLQQALAATEHRICSADRRAWSEGPTWHLLLLLAETAPEAVEIPPAEAPENCLYRFPDRSTPQIIALALLDGPGGTDGFGGLERSALRTLESAEELTGDPLLLRAALQARAMRFALASDDLAEARRRAAQTRENLEAAGVDATTMQIALQRLNAVERLTAPAPRAIPPTPSRIEAARLTSLDNWGSSDEDQRRASCLTAAQARDMSTLSLCFASEMPMLRADMVSQLWASHLRRRDRLALAGQIRHSTHARTTFTLWQGYGIAALDLQLARTVEDSEWASEIQPAFNALDEALSRRDIALLLRAAM